MVLVRTSPKAWKQGMRDWERLLVELLPLRAIFPLSMGAAPIGEEAVNECLWGRRVRCTTITIILEPLTLISDSLGSSLPPRKVSVPQRHLLHA